MNGFQHKNKMAAYKHIESSLNGLLGVGLITFEAALTSLIALVRENHPAVSWVGLYRAQQQHLFVGPYQGKLACVHLKPGQGVCGRAFLESKTLIVDDVLAFAGHVACDPLARSEIVVPAYQNGELIGVLDLDSTEPAAFDAYDQEQLEKLLKAIETLPERVILKG